MKKALFILAPALLGLVACGGDNPSSQGGSSISTEPVAATCQITIGDGATAKAYQKGTLLGEISPSTPLSLNTLKVGDSFTVQIVLDEGYAQSSAKLNGKRITGSSSFFKITLSEKTNEISFTFRHIDTLDSDFSFDFNDDKLEASITGYNPEEIPTPVVLPTTVAKDSKTYKVTSIAKDSFANSEATKISVSSSITSIDYGAFNNAYNLTDISVDSNNQSYEAINGILYTKGQKELHTCPAKVKATTFEVPSSVTSFADYSFYENRSISKIAFNDKLEEIGDSAFYNCTSLKELSAPSSLKKIGTNAFYQNSNLATVKFASGLEEIDDSAFYGSLKITSLVFPDSLKKIGGNAFFKCDRLSSIDFGHGIKEIGELAFSNETNITSISLPSSLKKIGNSAFSVCDKLETVTFAEGLEEIGNSAFALCSAITSIALPASLTTIGTNPFYAVLKLNSSNFSISSSNANFTIVDGVLYSKDQTKLICYPYGKAEESFTVPDGVSEFCCQSFRLVNSLKTITIPTSVTKLDECFYAMTSSLKINYQGTKDQWNAIDKTGSHGEAYNESSTVKVTCTDGEIA